MINWINVNSKSIIRIAYNFDINIMYINFRGSITDTPYQGVTEDKFRAFSNADDIDEYYKKHIQDVYVEVAMDTENVVGCRL